jgi:hypothetical protein
VIQPFNVDSILSTFLGNCSHDCAERLHIIIGTEVISADLVIPIPINDILALSQNLAADQQITLGIYCISNLAFDVACTGRARVDIACTACSSSDNPSSGKFSHGSSSHNLVWQSEFSLGASIIVATKTMDLSREVW